MKSEPDRGASFYVELPVGDGPVKPALPRPPERTRPIRAAGSVVLVVEDEAALGAAVAEALADAGFVVDRAGDGEEALERVQGRAYDSDHLRSEDAAGRRHGVLSELERDAPDLARRILFVTGDVAGTEPSGFSRRPAAAGSRSRSG